MPIVLLVACLATACMRQVQGLRPDEIDLVLVYVEEVAHGQPADPLELLRPDGSPALMQVASWAQGHHYGVDRFEHPNLIAGRRRRWPLLRQGLARGVLAYEEEDGALRLAPDAAEDDRRLLTPLVRQENLDRVAVVSVLLTRGALHGDLARRQRLIDGIVAERLRHAQAVGGQPWSASSTSTSAGEPTPSASRPDAGRRSEP